MSEWTRVIYESGKGWQRIFGTRHLVVRPARIGGWWFGVYELGDLGGHGLEEKEEHAALSAEFVAGIPNVALPKAEEVTA